MRFLMINCLKYALQCQNEILRKYVQQQRYLILLFMWISPQYYVNMGNPLIPDAEKHFAALLLSEFKNRHVKANINL